MAQLVKAAYLPIFDKSLPAGSMPRTASQWPISSRSVFGTAGCQNRMDALAPFGAIGEMKFRKNERRLLKLGTGHPLMLRPQGKHLIGSGEVQLSACIPVTRKMRKEPQ